MTEVDGDNVVDMEHVRDAVAVGESVPAETLNLGIDVEGVAVAEGDCVDVGVRVDVCVLDEDSSPADAEKLNDLVRTKLEGLKANESPLVVTVDATPLTTNLFSGLDAPRYSVEVPEVTDQPLVNPQVVTETPTLVNVVK